MKFMEKYRNQNAMKCYGGKNLEEKEKQNKKRKQLNQRKEIPILMI